MTYRDVTGQKFNKLTAIRRIDTVNKTKESSAIWLWSCECGNQVELPLNRVTSGNNKACGCLYKGLLTGRGKDIAGQRFHFLTAIKRVGTNKFKQAVWEWLCDCGNTTETTVSNLTSGHHKGCGCRISAKGANSCNWTGGKKKDSAGYVYVYSPDHPNSRPRRGYIAEHRLVMEKTLGRYLLRTEEVHHKNAIKDDNRPENLELWLRSRQPRGARASDLVDFAREILAQYGDLFPEK